MKKLLLLLLGAMTMSMVVPAARAHEKDPWHDADKTLHQLSVRMDDVNAYRDRLGAGPHLRDEIGQLRSGLADFNDRVLHRTGDPKAARKTGDDLSALMSQVEAEYRDRARRAGVVLHIDSAR